MIQQYFLTKQCNVRAWVRLIESMKSMKVWIWNKQQFFRDTLYHLINSEVQIGYMKMVRQDMTRPESLSWRSWQYYLPASPLTLPCCHCQSLPASGLIYLHLANVIDWQYLMSWIFFFVKMTEETNSSNERPANDNEQRQEQSNIGPVDESVTETGIDEGNDDINNNTLNDLNNNNAVEEPNNNNITYSSQTSQNTEVPGRMIHLDSNYPVPSPIPLSVPPPMYRPSPGSTQDVQDYPSPPLHHPQPQSSLCPCPAVYSDNSYYQLPPPDYQELSPSQLQYQPTLPR